MKQRIILIIVWVLLAGVLPAAAQDTTNLITLNDAAPSVDVVIDLPPDTTGTISLHMAQAAVTLTDETNATVFRAADARLHGLEFNIAPNSGSHTLTVQRLPGITEAYVQIDSLPEMTVSGTVNRIESSTLTLNQETALSLNADSPAGTVAVNIPDMVTGVVTAIFPGALATTQMIDSAGVVIAESTGGHVDGLSFLLDGGAYDFTVLSGNLMESVVAGVRAVSLEDSGFTLLNVPASKSVASVASDPSATCTALITANSVNLRSGPGTGYSVLDYGYLGEVFPVGGHNPENNWLVVGTPDGGAAWVMMDATLVQGHCDSLAVFNVPLKDASSAQAIIPLFGSGSSFTNDDDHFERAFGNDHDDDHGGLEFDD